MCAQNSDRQIRQYQGTPSPSKWLSVWSVEPVRPKPHRDHDHNQQGATDPPPRHQSELVKIPRRLIVAIFCPNGKGANSRRGTLLFASSAVAHFGALQRRA
jgi:hypothetical protein